MSSKVLVKRIERNKRKYVTAVSGLEAHGLDLKKVAKDFGKKFAAGSSVTKVSHTVWQGLRMGSGEGKGEEERFG